MNKNNILALLILLFAGFYFTNCDDNIPEYDNVSVESVTLDEELKSGVTLEEGKTLNIAGRVTIVPYEATDKMESFSSSNEDIAIVDAKGNITANAIGTTEITITVNGKTDKFTLTVIEREPIKVSEIILAIETLKTQVGRKVNLSTELSVLPDDAVNKELTYTSSDETVVKVDANGVTTGISIGTAVITIASKEVPSVSVDLDVIVEAFSGDYPREGWTMTASHKLPINTNNPEKNSIGAALDGDLTTNFCLVRPGKTNGSGDDKVSVPSGATIFFIVDMKEPREVDYFRIHHRDNTQEFIRYRKFDQILGSNDNVTFTEIANNVVVPDAAVNAVDITVNIPIPLSNYRYIKFTAGSSGCFNPSRGNTVQIKELYLGKQ